LLFEMQLDGNGFGLVTPGQPPRRFAPAQIVEPFLGTGLELIEKITAEMLSGNSAFPRHDLEAIATVRSQRFPIGDMIQSTAHFQRARARSAGIQKREERRADAKQVAKVSPC
jgi:hypothetical protein